jgi:hypothetical protein
MLSAWYVYDSVSYFTWYSTVCNYKGRLRGKGDFWASDRETGTDHDRHKVFVLADDWQENREAGRRYIAVSITSRPPQYSDSKPPNRQTTDHTPI